MSDKPISPLRRRMIEDMSVRKFGEKTQHDYIRQSRALPSSWAARPRRQAPRTCAAIRFTRPQPACSRQA
jgi:hypothetical protein